MVSISTGAVYKDDGKGEFANTTDPRDVLLPGWRTYIGGKNFSALVRDPQVRNPFLNVFWWTFVFAAGTVLLSFSIGLFLAIALDKRGMRFQRLYRSILIIPWAVPGVLSLLVWAGLLNDSVRRRQPDLPHQRPVAVRPEHGQGLVHPRQHLADRAVLLRRLDGRAPIDSRGAHGGRARRRRESVPDLPAE